MYSRQQASQIRQQFWTAFGKYMAPVQSATGEKGNWINYKTGIKGIYFRLTADTKIAEVAIEILLPDKDLQQRYYKELEMLQSLFETYVQDDWDWQPLAYTDDGKEVSKVSTTLNNVNIFKTEDWPQLITFFKQHLISLDAFWNEVKFHFEMI